MCDTLLKVVGHYSVHVTDGCKKNGYEGGWGGVGGVRWSDVG